MLTILLAAAMLHGETPAWERMLDDILTRAEAERPLKLQPDPAPQPEPPVHPMVDAFARNLETSGRFQAARRRLAEYERMIDGVLAQEGLPRNLKWIGLVESGYDPQARSPMNAVGIWQLIPETAQAYGIDESERTDPLKSTRAAARYLRFLYAKFRDWPLVLAAYNAGERRILDAITRAGAADFWRISALLPRETQAYVPAVLAAQHLGEGERAEPAAAPNVVFAPFSLQP